MCAAGFPEPKTFGTRVARLLRDRVDDFDVVHDNQVLATGMLDIERLGLPVVTTIHHPITVDRRLDLAAAHDLARRLTLRRWYGFLRMQRRVARQARSVLTPSDVVQARHRRRLRRRPRPGPGDPARRRRRVPAADRAPGARPDRRDGQRRRADEGHRDAARGLRQAAHRARHLELLLVTKPQPGGRTEQIVDRLAIRDHVRFVHGISDAELVEVMGSAEVACVPSLYEGFSLPTAELMACGTPLVVSDAGAIPEVVGPDGLCADLVPPGDVDALAGALARLLDDPERRARYGAAGRARVDERFSWRAVAAATAAAYQEAIGGPCVLTVDFDRLGLLPGDRALDMGCGAGRHAFEMYRRGADVIAFDQDADELARCATCSPRCGTAGEVPAGAEADVKEGDALALPFADGEFDRVVAAEILEHVPADIQAIQELVRVHAARRHRGAHRAALVPRDRLLAAVATTTTTPPAATSGSTPTRSWPPRPRTPASSSPARATPTACTRRTGGSSARSASRTTRNPVVQGVPPAAGLGHHEAAPHHPARRAGPRPGDRQEPGPLLPQADA